MKLDLRDSGNFGSKSCKMKIRFWAVPWAFERDSLALIDSDWVLMKPHKQTRSGTGDLFVVREKWPDDVKDLSHI